MPFLIGTIFENCDKWYCTWRAEHPEFTRIVFHGLRHSSMTTTQKTYLHIIQELENQDIDLVMRSLSGLS